MDVDLAARLRSRREASSRTHTPEVAAAYAANIRRVRSEGVVDAALGVGDRAPRFTLPDLGGHPVDLATMLAVGPVIVSFFRGGWCPYCVLELRAYQEEAERLIASDVGLLAITPQLPDLAARPVEEHGFGFPVLYDGGNRVARSFGIVHTVAADVLAIYRERGIDLERHHGTGTREDELPLPATFVIDRRGIVRFAFASADYTERAEPNDVIDVALAL